MVLMLKLLNTCNYSSDLIGSPCDKGSFTLLGK